MKKLLSLAVLGLAGVSMMASAAEAGLRRGCCQCPPSCCSSGPAAVAPSSDKNAPPPPVAPPADAQVYRSYSYEPQNTGYRSYSRSSGRSFNSNRYDATSKMRGQY